MIKINDASYEADLVDAFPTIDAGATPLGARVLVQLRKAKKKMTSSGILLVRETTDTEKAQNCVGKVVGLGPLAFKKRDTMESCRYRRRMVVKFPKTVATTTLTIQRQSALYGVKSARQRRSIIGSSKSRRTCATTSWFGKIRT